MTRPTPPLLPWVPLPGLPPRQRAGVLVVLAALPLTVDVVWGWRAWALLPLGLIALAAAGLGRWSSRALVWAGLGLAAQVLAVAGLAASEALPGLALAALLLFAVGGAALFVAWCAAAGAVVRGAGTEVDSDAVATRCARGARLAVVSAGAGLVLADEDVLPVAAACALVALGVVAWMVREDRVRLARLEAIAAGRVAGLVLRPPDRAAPAQDPSSADLARVVRVDAEAAGAPFRQVAAEEVLALVAIEPGTAPPRPRAPRGQAARRRAFVEALAAAAALALVATLNHEWLGATGLSRLGVIDPPSPDVLRGGTFHSRNSQDGIVNAYERVGDVRVPGGWIWRGTVLLDLSDESLLRYFVTDEGRLLAAPAVMARVRDRPLAAQVRVRLALEESLARHALFDGQDARRRGLRAPWREGHAVHAWVRHPQNPTPHHLVFDFAAGTITDLTP